MSRLWKNHEVRPPWFPKRIVSFEKIEWNISGMRSIRNYEIVNKGDTADIAEYEMYYRDRKEERRLLRNAECRTEELLKLLNECSIMKWNGFNGKHPLGVKDGEMFSFEAEVNDGEKIKASGSANFPKHFWDFCRAVNEMLKPVEG